MICMIERKYEVKLETTCNKQHKIFRGLLFAIIWYFETHNLHSEVLNLNVKDICYLLQSREMTYIHHQT